MGRNSRRFVSLCRTLHIYLTAFGAVMMLFFSVTGFMLNHKEWFGPKEKGRRPPGAEAGLASARPDAPPGPPAAPRGVLTKLMNLHKGAGVGTGWKLAIDATAVLLFVGSVTGLVLLLSLPHRRRLGLIAAGIGTALCLAAYCMATS